MPYSICVILDDKYHTATVVLTGYGNGEIFSKDWLDTTPRYLTVTNELERSDNPEIVALTHYIREDVHNAKIDEVRQLFAFDVGESIQKHIRRGVSEAIAEDRKTLADLQIERKRIQSEQAALKSSLLGTMPPSNELKSVKLQRPLVNLALVWDSFMFYKVRMVTAK